MVISFDDRDGHAPQIQLRKDLMTIGRTARVVIEPRYSPSDPVGE
jgi:hypothetical protein